MYSVQCSVNDNMHVISIFYLCLSKIASNERRCHTCNIISLCLILYRSMDKNGSSSPSNNILDRQVLDLMNMFSIIWAICHIMQYKNKYTFLFSGTWLWIRPWCLQIPYPIKRLNNPNSSKFCQHEIKYISLSRWNTDSLIRVLFPQVMFLSSWLYHQSYTGEYRTVIVIQWNLSITTT